MLHSIDSVVDVNAAVNAVESAVNAPETPFDSEETTYFLEELHPEGDFDAEITAAKEVKGYIVVEFETKEGSLAKFYSISNQNGRTKIDQYMRYLIKAAGVPTNGFTLSSLIGKVVTATVKHYEDKHGETAAGVTKIQ